MATGYARQSAASIVTGLVVAAAPINAELNAILAFCDATTGHAHDGTAGGGGKIDLVNSIKTSTKLPLANGGTNADLSTATAGATITMNTGATALTYIKNNYSAIVAPAVTDDTSSGYSPGSLWINTAAGTFYICTTSTAGAATWVLLSASTVLSTVIGKVQITSLDTTPSVLDSAVAVTAPLVKVTNNPGADETLGLSVSAATTAAAGVSQLASTAVTQALASTTTVVTPASLGGTLSTTTQLGIVQLATSAEVVTGTDTAKAATAAGVAAAITANVDYGQLTLHASIYGI